MQKLIPPTSVNPTLICLAVLKKSRDSVPNPLLLNPWQREVGVHSVEDEVVLLRGEEIGVEREIVQTSVEIEVDSEAAEAHIVDSFPGDSAQHGDFETENVMSVNICVPFVARNRIVFIV